MLPEGLAEPLKLHLAHVRDQHEFALEKGNAGVELPYALERKYPDAYRGRAMDPEKRAPLPAKRGP